MIPRQVILDKLYFPSHIPKEFETAGLKKIREWASRA